LPPFWAILPPFCHPIGFESGRGQPLSGTQGKRVATFALVTTVGPQPRPARSTPGELGRAANRQAFASLSHPANRQVVRNPHVGRTGFLVSMIIHPRTAVRRGRHAGLLLIPNAKDGRYDPDIHSLRQSGRGYSLNEPTFPGPPDTDRELGATCDRLERATTRVSFNVSFPPVGLNSSPSLSPSSKTRCDSRSPLSFRS
jgi:hypothetical protein